MKSLLMNTWVWILGFLSPIFPIFLIITIAVVFDTFVGRWYAKQKGELITSGKTRRGVTVKLLIYLSVIFFSFLIDKYMINEITRNYIWFDYAFTRFWGVFFVWIEYTSIDEKVKWVTGKGLTDRIGEFVKSLKKPFEYIVDLKNKV
jgi:hypothetical protein